MKKSLIGCIIIVLVFTGFNKTYAQENVFKFNIFSPIFSTLNVSYERKLDATSSLQLGFFYTGYKQNDTKFSGVGFTPEYRFYLSETEAPIGVYIAPFLRYQNFELTLSGTDSEGKLSMFGGGLVIGRQWIFKERISLDAFIGPSFTGGEVKVISGQDTFDSGPFDGFRLRGGLTLGIAF